MAINMDNNFVVKKNTDETTKINIKDDLVYITFPALEKTGLVKHCFSTRLGGVSEGIFSSLNLGFNRGDSEENVYENFKRLCSSIDIDERRLVFSNQIHEDKIYVVTEKDCGKGIIYNSDIIGIDGLITNVPNVPLVTFYADCVPIYFIDTVNKAIGLTHSGWRSTVKKIGIKTIEAMQREYNSNPSDIITVIAPSICKDCYEVSEDVAEEFRKVFTEEQYRDIVAPKDNGKYLLDLWQANKYILLDGGVREDNINITDICTCCNPELLFSHRASNGQRGSLAAIMSLK